MSHRKRPGADNGYAAILPNQPEAKKLKVGSVTLVAKNPSCLVHSSKRNPPLPSLKKRPRMAWTPEEDDALTELIKQQKGVDLSNSSQMNIDWCNIAKKLSTPRSAKQCRDRWQTFLRPGIKKGSWTIEEESLIRDMYTTFGARWSAMAKLFHDRTDSDIKNKWYAMVRREERLRRQIQSDRNRRTSHLKAPPESSLPAVPPSDVPPPADAPSRVSGGKS